MSQEEALRRVHRERIMFACYPAGQMAYAEQGDERTHEEWMIEDNIVPDRDAYLQAPRGYLSRNGIHWYFGDHHNQVDLYVIMAMTPDVIAKLGPGTGVNVYNGVVMGEPGEYWKPMELVGVTCTYMGRHVVIPSPINLMKMRGEVDDLSNIIINNIAAEAGWNDATIIELLSQFIDGHNKQDELNEFLQFRLLEDRANSTEEDNVRGKDVGVGDDAG